MNSPYAKRLKKILNTLKKEAGDAALLLSSAPEISSSRDESYPYKQHTDLYYLTGSTRQDIALLVTTKCDKPILFAVKDDPRQVLWQGAREDPKEIATRCSAELVYCSDLFSEILPGMNGIDTLYYQNIPNTVAWHITKRLIEQPSWLRGPMPQQFKHSDVLIAPLRLIKDAFEIKQIENAIAITAASLNGVVPLMTAGSSEAEIASAFDYNMAVRGARPAFKSIIAAGASASVLHYTSLNAVLRNKQLLMIDCGAEANMYCADITRTYPIGGHFSGVLKDLYEIVLAAQTAAIKTVKAGVRMQKVHLAAAKVLTEGLIDLKVLKGKSNELFNKHAYSPYFPHSIGHSLGLDVHDIGRLRADRSCVLEEGMVITIEPGLYFQKAVAGLPRCGIRIEDDVLVKKTGCRVLSAAIPKSVADLENLFQR